MNQALKFGLCLLVALFVASATLVGSTSARAGTAEQAAAPSPTPVPLGTGDSRYFSQTGRTVRGLFLTYWNANGGLAQQGYPISGEISERSDTDGKVYTVQYFERAVFEYHPENPPPNNVLLSLLGVFLYKQKYPDGAPNQQETTAKGGVLFVVTGKHLGGVFLNYWRDHGALAQQGFPISEEFTEVNDLDHKPYKVQYMERAVFEWHPENDPPYDVLLSQLGTFRYKQKHGPQAATSGSLGSQPPALMALLDMFGRPAPAR